MTIEELNIVVEANVEKAIKEFERLLPTIKKQLLSIQKEFKKVNIKDITANINMTKINKEVKQAKNKIKEVFDPNDISGMTINGKLFEIENIKGYSKEVQKLKGQMGTLDRFKIPNVDSRENTSKNFTTNVDKKSNVKPKNNMENNIKDNQNVEIKPTNESINIWEILKQKIQQIKPFIEQFKQSLNNGNSSKGMELIKYKISEVEEKLEKAKNGEIHLNTKEIIKTEAQLEKLNQEKGELEKNRKKWKFF